MNSTSKFTNKTESPSRLRLTSRHIILTASMLIVIGYILMGGSGSTEQTFNPDIFSARRTVVAPLLCLSGYLLMVIGILRK